MSKLHDLIAQLCPDGVPYRKLGEVSRVFGGYAFKSKEYTVSGARVMRISDVQAGYISNENAKYCPINQPKQADSAKLLANDLLVSLTGNVGRVAMVDNTVLPAYLNQRVAGIRTTDAINHRFLFHYLNQHQFIADCERAGKGSAQKNLSMGYLTNYEVPLPPLPVQAEVVRILDAFTELEAELAGRIEQYEYYRDYLLDEKNLEAMDGKPVETKKLGDICIRQRGTRITAKQMKENACSDGDILIFGGGKTKVYAKKFDVPSKDIITCPSVVVKSRGNIGFEYCDVPFTHKSELWSYSSNDEAVNIKFISYYLENNRRFFQDAANIGKLPQIATGVTDNYDVPVPSLATQERVVDILDRFDALTTSLTDGIPAEIAMRREQHEYYRSRLIDFPRLPEDSNNDGE